MSILPSFKATLDSNLTADQCKDVIKQIEKISGVVSVAFNEAAGSEARHADVTFYFTLNSVNNSVTDRVSKIAGVKEVTPTF